MSTKSETSAALRQIGRAGPNPAEMDLLRAATLEPTHAIDAWDRWAAAHSIDTASKRAMHLLPAVSANVPEDALGPSADRMRGLRRRNWVETELRMSALHDAVDVLASIGVEPLVTKGAALVSTTYTTPGVRPMWDVDIMIDHVHFDDAVRALTARGWGRTSTVDSPFDHAIELCDPRHRAIDLHRWVLFPRFAPEPETRWIERAVPHRIGDSHLTRFRCSDELVLDILHGVLTSGTSSARWPLDVVQAARNAPDVDGLAPHDFWDEVIRSAAEIGAGPLVADALELCRAELGAPVPAAVVGRMAETALDRQLSQAWALCRHGVTPQWRYRRYRRMQQIAGARGTITGYAVARLNMLRSKGLRSAVTGRIGHVRSTIDDKREAADVRRSS